jgi:hypothetical protein
MLFYIVIVMFQSLTLDAGEAYLFERFIGAWESTTNHSNGTSVYMDVLYKDDGSCSTYVEFTIKNSLTLYADVEELCEISDDLLNCKVVSSTNKELFKVGEESKAKIISITENTITLKEIRCDGSLGNTEWKLIRK